MKRGAGLVVVPAVLIMLAGGFLALRPFLFRETVALQSSLADTPESAAFSRGVRLALEEYGFRAGVFRVAHQNLSPQAPGYWTDHQAPRTVRFPRRNLHVLQFPAQSRTPSDYFRHRTEHRREGVLAADWASQTGIRSAYLLADRLPSTEDYFVSSLGIVNRGRPTTGFLDTSRKNGLSMAGAEAFPEGDFEYRHLMARVARWKTDMVYVDAGGQGARVVRDLRARGYRGRILLSSRSVPDDYPSLAGSAKGVYSIWALEAPPPLDFALRFQARFGAAADPNAYRGYDEALTFLKTIGQRAVRRPADLEKALQTTLDPFVDSDRFAVYACREGRFDLVEVLP